LRVIISGTFLFSILTTSFSDLGRLPVTALIPTGLMKLLPWSFYDRLFTPLGMACLKGALVVSLSMSVVGFLTPVSTKTSALLVLFYQGLVRSFGHFNHDEMIGVYFLIVLAFSPCAEAISIDSRRKGFAEKPACAYGYPILLMQSLMAWSYFSSALIKLRVSGFSYLNPDNLPTLAIWQSLDNLHDTHFRLAFYLPAIRQYTPILVGLVLAWELVFPLAVFWKRSRWVILGFGIVFHVATLFLLNFMFFYQMAMYVVFVDWQRVLVWFRKRRLYGSIASGLNRFASPSSET
jgi:hypothetical protein